MIQRASERALKHDGTTHGTTLGDVLAIAADLRRERPEAGLVIFSYYNPILRFGLERFCAAAEHAGVDGVLVTDMIVEEATEYLSHLERHHLVPIFLAAPTSPDERLERIAAVSRGFVYAISRTGITGTQQSLASRCEGSGLAPAPFHRSAHSSGVSASPTPSTLPQSASSQMRR